MKVYIFGGGETKKDGANNICEIMYCRDFLEGRNVMLTKCIPMKFLSSSVAPNTLNDCAVIPSLKGYLILGNKKEIYYVKPDEKMVNIGITKYKMTKSWINESLAFIVDNNLIYYAVVKPNAPPQRNIIILK